MKIGDMSRRAGVPVETVRYYEKIGLLPEPDRHPNGYRDYRPAHLDRLLFIKRCRTLDMAQDEIRELIQLTNQPDADCHGVDALIARHLQHVRARIGELQSLERVLTRLKDACSDPRTVAECGILDGLNSELDALDKEAADQAARDNHIPGSHGH